MNLDLKHQSELNPRYTFDTFVVTDGTRLAYAAAQAVVRCSGKKHNPLFICGGVGLGKTHLMQAMSHELGKCRPDNSVYCSTERLTSAMIRSIRQENMNGFIDQLRAIDVLLVDDIQFLAGKERTTEAFVQLFRELHDEGKQLVIAGCRSSKELSDIVDSLGIPIQSGVIIEIEPPDYQTMLVILHKKAESNGIVIPVECSQFIASRVHNVRELEGALANLTAYASLTGAAISPQTAQRVFRT